MRDIARRLAEKMEADLRAAFDVPVQRQTALAFRGGAFVTLDLDDAGNVIEPPKPCPKCGPVLKCSDHLGN